MRADDPDPAGSALSSACHWECSARISPDQPDRGAAAGRGQEPARNRPGTGQGLDLWTRPSSCAVFERDVRQEQPRCSRPHLRLDARRLRPLLGDPHDRGNVGKPHMRIHERAATLVTTSSLNPRSGTTERRRTNVWRSRSQDRRAANVVPPKGYSETEGNRPRQFGISRAATAAVRNACLDTEDNMMDLEAGPALNYVLNAAEPPGSRRVNTLPSAELSAFRGDNDVEH